MRNVIVAEYVSLDGMMDNPAWTGPYFNEELETLQHDLLMASDVLLLGRLTYEGFAGAWPTMTDENGFADRMNSLPKFVVSTTLEKAEWNASLIQENVAEEVAQLKQQPGQHILIYGSGELVQTLMQHNLIDEYRLIVFPVVLGRGKRFFKDGSDISLTLIDTKMTSSGVVILTYGQTSSLKSVELT